MIHRKATVSPETGPRTDPGPSTDVIDTMTVCHLIITFRSRSVGWFGAPPRPAEGRPYPSVRVRMPVSNDRSGGTMAGGLPGIAAGPLGRGIPQVAPPGGGGGGLPA